jgi:hypothetical protein
MPHPFASYETGMAQQNTYGGLSRLIVQALTATTAATTTSGFNTVRRMPNAFTMPAYGAGVEAAVMTRFSVISGFSGSTYFAAIETQLGSLNMNTGTFTDGSAMPTATHYNDRTGALTASYCPVLHVSVAHTATTPLITTTYTDQDGNTGNTCSMTLPSTSALDTCYFMAPHLATGDTGIRDVTAQTKSAGTAGTLRTLGLRILAYQMPLASGAGHTLSPIWMPAVDWDIETGDVIGFYQIGQNGSGSAIIDTEFLAVSA